MKTCKACGSINDDGSEFCSKCGEYFDAPAAANADAVPVGGDDRGFTKVVESIIGRLGEEPVIDDAMYASILDECVEAVFYSVSKPGVRTRSRIADLAILIDDHDLIIDLLKAISDRAQRIGYQKELLNASTEYVFIAIEGFAVYTDLNDLQSICTEAVSAMDSLAGRMPSLEPAQLKYSPVLYVESYSQFFKLVGAKVDAMIASCDPERIEFLSDYWASKSGKSFAEVLLAVANMNIQLIAAGKLGSKLITKARDSQLDMFQKTFMSPKQ